MEINIATLTSAVVASLITLIATKLWDWWRESQKIKGEDRKLLNKALFVLMSFWQTLQSWDFEKQIAKSERLINMQLGEMAKRENRDFPGIQFSQADKDQITAFQRQKATEKLADLLDQMNRSIEELSVIRPLIAAEIRDMQLRSPFEVLEEYVQAEREKKAAPPDQFSEHMTMSMLNQQFQLFKNVLSERLEPFIRLIAKDINAKTLKDTEMFLKDFGANWADAFGDDDVDTDAKAIQAGIDMFTKAASTAPTTDVRK